MNVDCKANAEKFGVHIPRLLEYLKTNILLNQFDIELVETETIPNWSNLFFIHLDEKYVCLFHPIKKADYAD